MHCKKERYDFESNLIGYRLGQGIMPKEALLIDNEQANLDAWATVGGLGYLFTTDEQFHRDLKFSLNELAASTDLKI